MMQLAQRNRADTRSGGATRRKGEATHEAILGHALELASVHGLEGISIGALARETGLSKSGLFAHFGSKEKLQIEILDAAAERFLDVVVRPARRERAGEPRLRRIFGNWLDWGGSRGSRDSGSGGGALRGGCLFVASCFEFDDRPGPVRDHLVFLQRGWIDILARAVERGKEAGDFRTEIDARQFAHDLYGIVLGYYHAARLLGDPQAKTRARTAFEALIGNAR
jgi:AcrR family transcriptional regulator